VRKNSAKQSAASRANGAKSSGPTSAAGKEKSKVNALKKGLFSKEVVVAAAGESAETFEALRAELLAAIQPDDAVQLMIADDLVVNWWRRQRVRRAEAADLQLRLENLKIHDNYLRSDEIDSLKIRFQVLCERYLAPRTNSPFEDIAELVVALEHARSQLSSTSVGLKFLSAKVEAVKSEASSMGQMSEAAVRLLRACVGMTSDLVTYVIGFNQVIKNESGTSAEGEKTGKSGAFGEGAGKEKPDTGSDIKTMLVCAIEMAEWQLLSRAHVLEIMEKWQGTARCAAAVVPIDSKPDTFERAETTYDRRFYRALAAWWAMKRGSQ
jgi:hypothetical protein